MSSAVTVGLALAVVLAVLRVLFYLSVGLATALVGRDGKIAKILRGNSWAASEAVDALNKL